MNLIQQEIEQVLPPRRKSATKGWISFNAPCCTHNGETPDKRQRGGILFGDDGGFSYHCFNCKFKASWKPGYHLSYRVRRLLSWFGMPQEQIQRLVFEAMRDLDHEVVQVEREKKEASFAIRELPECANILELYNANAHEYDVNLRDTIKYIESRGFSLKQFDWRWSPETVNKMNRRLIIPFTWQNKIVGYTARAIDEVKTLKYINHIDSGYVFNIDRQTRDRQFVIVVEGPLDAIAVDGVAVLTNEVPEEKADIIESLGKEIIVVPDIDKDGSHLVDVALQYNWNVSFPNWEPGVKDCAQAMQKYGKLYTLRSILEGKHSSSLKIELIRKQYGI